MSDQLARDIEILADLFKTGGWSELRVEGNGISLLLSNDPATTPIGGQANAPAAASSPPPPVGKAQPAAGLSAAAGPSSTADADPAWAAVTAPNLGTFYRSPKPGSPPFVEVGQRVAADTEVCLIEVMKLFTSVKAGVAGTVRNIAAADAALVEGGQVLLYIERD